MESYDYKENLSSIKIEFLCYKEIDQYVDSILKNILINNEMLETIDIDEIERYVDEYLKSRILLNNLGETQLINELVDNSIIYVEQNEMKEPDKQHNIIQYNTYKKNNTNQCNVQ